MARQNRRWHWEPLHFGYLAQTYLCCYLGSVISQKLYSHNYSGLYFLCVFLIKTCVFVSNTQAWLFFPHNLCPLCIFIKLVNLRSRQGRQKALSSSIEGMFAFSFPRRLSMALSMSRASLFAICISVLWQVTQLVR